ncbi:MAG TPA: energy transducer TonB [Myxococcota bacterium]|nr:energy transducer TonB [Myxococcota bacterium]
MLPDSPWRRLGLTLPLALFLNAALLAVFLRILSFQAGPSAPAPVSLEARFLEVAPPAVEPAAAPLPVAPAAPEPPPPARRPAAKPAARRRPSPEPPSSPTPVTPAESATAAPPQTAETRGPALDPPRGKISARALYRPLPDVPERLRHRELALVAVARFQVATDGTVQVELVEPTTDPALNGDLIAKLRTWRFFPALEDGQPVASTLEVRIPISVR